MKKKRGGSKAANMVVSVCACACGSPRLLPRGPCELFPACKLLCLPHHAHALGHSTVTAPHCVASPPPFAIAQRRRCSTYCLHPFTHAWQCVGGHCTLVLL